MPHIVIEFAAEALPDRDAVERFMHDIMSAASKAEAIVPANVKMRAVRHEHVLVAGRSAPFVHITASLMSRPDEHQLEQLADLLFEGADQALPHLQNVTVDIRDMNPQTYRKRKAPAPRGAQNDA